MNLPYQCGDMGILCGSHTSHLYPTATVTALSVREVQLISTVTTNVLISVTLSQTTVAQTLYHVKSHVRVNHNHL